MSQAQPFQPNLHPEDQQGIPAADPGPGAPPAAPGFGEGYEPARFEDDEAAQGDSDDDPAAESPPVEDAERIREESNAFNPPDPDDLQR